MYHLYIYFTSTSSVMYIMTLDIFELLFNLFLGHNALVVVVTNLIARRKGLQ